MNRLYTILLIACITIGFAACTDDDCNGLHLDNLANYPNVLKGTFPTEEQVLELGETLEVTPELLNPEGATYSWLLNGKEYSTEPSFSYPLDNPCRADLTCIITNKYGKVEMKTSFRTNHDFSKGFFYAANVTLNFYNTEENIAYLDCYGSLNAGQKFASSSSSNYLHIDSYNGKLYVLLESNTSNIKHLFVLDAQTLYLENSAAINAGLCGINIINDKYGLIWGDGISRIDLHSLSSTKLLDKYSFNIYNALIFNGKVLTNDTYSKESKVKYYDVNQLLVAEAEATLDATELDITQKQKTNFVQASDGNVYTLESTEEGCNLVKISNDFKLEKTATGFQQTTAKWYTPTVGMVASETENIIYIPSADGTIYKYVINDASSLQTPFIAADAAGLPIAATPQLDQKNGNLYVIYGQSKESKIVVYDKNGTVLNTIDCGSGIPSHILLNN